MNGTDGERIECNICGHAWRLTPQDAERGSAWCDLCQESRTLSGGVPNWMNRPEPPSTSRPASGLGLLLKGSVSAPPAAPAPQPTANRSTTSANRSTTAKPAAPPSYAEPAPAPTPPKRSGGISRQGYPATIHHKGPGRRQASVRLPGPILRHLTVHQGIHLERPARGGDALITAPESIRPGDRVMLRIRDGKLIVSETLTSESYARETNRLARTFLVRESEPFTHIDEIRAARLRMEAWLGLPRDDRHPWSIPGELKNGSLILSRRVLAWCQARISGREDPESWLQRGFPRPEDWGPGPMSFCVRLEEYDPHPTFRSLVVSTAEHQLQHDVWKMMLDTDAQLSLGPELSLPAPLLGLMRRLELPVPRADLPEAQSILAAWSTSRSPALARRAMAMFLLERVQTETQRISLRGLGIADRQLETLYDRWCEAGRPIVALQGMVEPEEIGPALEALALNAEAREIHAGLRERWEKQVATSVLDQHAAQSRQTQQQRQDALMELESLRRQSAELRRRQEQEARTLESKLRLLREQIATVAPLLAATARVRPKLPTRTATRTAVREELIARGLSLTPTQVDRLLLATLSSPRAGVLLALSDPTGRASDVLSDLFEGADDTVVPVRAEWRAESDLLGRVSPDGLRFVPAPFTEAARRAGAHAITVDMKNKPAPFLLHLRGADRADVNRYAAGLLAALGTDRRLELYPRSLNARWIAELEQMKAARSHDSNRFAELEQAFSAEALGGGDPKSAWQLQLPPHTVVLATLAQRQLSGTLSMLREHCFFVPLPPPDLSDVLSLNSEGQQHRLLLSPLPANAGDFSKSRAMVEEGLRTLLPILPPPSQSLGRQLSALFSEASRWKMDDGPELAGHILSLTALPRLRGDNREPLVQLAALHWVTRTFGEDINGLLR